MSTATAVEKRLIPRVTRFWRGLTRRALVTGARRAETATPSLTRRVLGHVASGVVTGVAYATIDHWLADDPDTGRALKVAIDRAKANTASPTEAVLRAAESAARIDDGYVLAALAKRVNREVVTLTRALNVNGQAVYRLLDAVNFLSAMPSSVHRLAWQGDNLIAAIADSIDRTRLAAQIDAIPDDEDFDDNDNMPVTTSLVTGRDAPGTRNDAEAINFDQAVPR